jgi:predicted  nucleic acid-binding Zn-ribbon protein
MFFRLHKLIVTGAAVAILGGFFFGRDAFSYVATAAGWMKDSVRSSVPVEFEIERARKMVKDLVPDIRRNMHVIAQEEVEVERAEKQIGEMENKLAKDRDEMLRLKTDLSTQNVSFEYGKRKYTVDEVKTDLAHRFERYKTHDATLASLRDIRTARSRSLAAAQQKLDGMLAAKRQLEVDVENLEARLKMVEVAQTTSSYHIDDSQLGRARDLIADVRTRLNVAERMVNVEDKLQGEIPLDEPTPANIVDQVSEYFNDSDGKVADVK